MLPYRRIGSDSKAGILLRKERIQQIAHPVKFLEFKGSVTLAGGFTDLSNCQGVMRCKLTVDIWAGHKGAHAGLIGHIGMRLAGKHWVVSQPLLLGYFNFGVPVSALY